ncbi:MAG: SdrD B-like domain-containing protein [Planctomycetales bacterium]
MLLKFKHYLNRLNSRLIWERKSRQRRVTRRAVSHLEVFPVAEQLEERALLASAGQINGFVYLDAGNDGGRYGDAPIVGASLTLTGTTSLGAAITRTATTGADGSYRFSNLPASNTQGYRITETQPAGYLDGKDKLGTLGGNATVNDVFSRIVVGLGTTGQEYNFGELLPAQINGFVYSDPNNDGVFQPTESGIAGATVTLTGTNDLGAAVNLTAPLTGSSGAYNFSNLRPGTYTITETQPAGYLDGKDTRGTVSNGGLIGSQANDKFINLGLNSGSVAQNYLFGELLPASIGDFVWRDTNTDGIQDPGEPGLAGVTVTLYTSANVQVGSPTVTDANGLYAFANLYPGNYYVIFTPPAGQVVASQFQGGDPTKDSNADATGKSDTFTLVAGASNPTIDAGFLPIDLSLTKSVDDSTPTIGSNVVFTITVSNALGFSAATGVTVRDVLPGGLTYVSDDAGGAYDNGTGIWTVGTLSPGGNATLHITATVTTGETKNNLAQVQSANQTDYDSTPGNAPGVHQDDDATASLTPSASIGDYVWRDTDNDGIQDLGEAGISGVTVTLFTSANVQVGSATVTDANGQYTFSDIDPGNYYGRAKK